MSSRRRDKAPADQPDADASTGEGAREEQREPNAGSSLSTSIDSVVDKINEAESLVERVTSPSTRESVAPRWLAKTVGLLSLPLCAVLALGSFGMASAIVEGDASDWQSMVALAVIAALSVFFGMLSFRLLLDRPNHYGHVLSPHFMIAFGVLFLALTVWMFSLGEGNWFGVMFSLASLSSGLAWRKQSGVATRRPRQPKRKHDD